MKLSVCLNYPWTWKNIPHPSKLPFSSLSFLFFFNIACAVERDAHSCGPLTRMFRHRGRWVGQLFQLFFSSVSTGEGDHMPRWSPLAVKLYQPPGGRGMIICWFLRDLMLPPHVLKLRASAFDPERSHFYNLFPSCLLCSGATMGWSLKFLQTPIFSFLKEGGKRPGVWFSG